MTKDVAGNDYVTVYLGETTQYQISIIVDLLERIAVALEALVPKQGVEEK